MRQVRALALLILVLFSADSAPRATPLQQQAASPTSAITGVVIEAGTARPLASAVVTLTAPGLQVQRLLSDSKGRFVFRNIPAHSGYLLSATRQGFFDGSISSPLSVAENQWISDQRLELARHSVIAGTILDENGDPVVAAPVRVLMKTLVAGHPHLASGPLVKTDDRGMYRAGGLRAGRYLVEVLSIQQSAPSDPAATMVDGRETSAAPAQLRDKPSLDLAPDTRLVIGSFPAPPAEVSRAYPLTFHPGTASFDEAIEVELASGAAREGVDVQLRPQPAWRVSGRTEGPGGSATGMVLRLVPSGLEDLAMGNESATSIVDRQGRFTFLNVPEGRYTLDGRSSFLEFRLAEGGINSVTLETPGFGMRGMSAAPFRSGTDTLMWMTQTAGADTSTGRVALAVSARDMTEVVLPMMPGVDVTGAVVQDDGSPVPEVTTVTLEPADGSPATGMWMGRSARGVFPIRGVRAGRYAIRVLERSVRSIMWGNHDLTRAPLDVQPGVDISNIVITVTSQTPVLTGQVTGLPRDQPAGVIAFPVDRSQWISYGLQAPYLSSTTVSSTAGFRFSSLPAGDYFLAAVPFPMKDRWNDPEFLERAAVSATAITLAWGDTKAASVKFQGDMK
jgi:hypothetical protein